MDYWHRGARCRNWEAASRPEEGEGETLSWRSSRMPDGDEHKTWWRRHRNEWIAIVVEVKVWGRFTAIATRDEETGLGGNYASLDQAQAAADAEARAADGHTCETPQCGWWSK